MWSATIVAVACFVGVAHADTPLIKLLESLKYPDTHYQDAFDGINVKPPADKIDMADLDALLWHGEAAFAKKKFINMIDSTDPGEDVCLDEIKTFMDTPAVKQAVFECSFLISESLRESCYADQCLTYIYLRIDKDSAHAFFDFVEGEDADNDICKDEIMKLAPLYTGFDENDVDNLMKEIGGDDAKITEEEFTAYIIQEDISDDFRECRTELKELTATYDHECMFRELCEYTKKEMTEKDMAALFDKLDKNDDLAITAEEAKGIMDGIMQALDRNKDAKIGYGEFRAYLKSHSVEVQLEKKCTENFALQADELKCLETLLKDLVAQNHQFPWLFLPDLDMLFLFEELDDNENGLIKIKEDLVKKGWNENVARKFVQYMDFKEKDDKIDLEEFFHYTDEPHMLYGIADCFNDPKTADGKLKNYIAEMQDVIEDMLETEEVEKFYKYYDEDGSKTITKEDLTKLGIGKDNDDADNFLWELGMGDQKITEYEFDWFVRQQRLSDLFKGKTEPADLHKILMDYLEKIMTEFDTEKTFDELDKDDDWELSDKDNKDLWPKISFMDTEEDTDKTVNFREFWLGLNLPKTNPRKIQLEKLCTEPKMTQAEEVTCYVEKMCEIKA